MIENNRLQAVISMPSGVFKPYAGVSTAILIFTKTGHGGTDQVWFYDMKADGFSLDDKRSETKENDIPDIIERFHHLDAEAVAKYVHDWIEGNEEYPFRPGHQSGGRKSPAGFRRNTGAYSEGIPGL